MNTSSVEQITGYRHLDSDDIHLINTLKAKANEIGAMIDLMSRDPDVDQRWLAIAKTDLQKGFMALVRSVAKPEGF